MKFSENAKNGKKKFSEKSFVLYLCLNTMELLYYINSRIIINLLYIIYLFI
jgi:hypothetical protein